jgi:predicted transcriptional regulator
MTREQQTAVLDRAKSWPSEQLEEAVEILLALESRAKGVYRLSDEERVDVLRGLEEADRGEFATDEEVAAVFKRFRL